MRLFRFAVLAALFMFPAIVASAPATYAAGVAGAAGTAGAAGAGAAGRLSGGSTAFATPSVATPGTAVTFTGDGTTSTTPDNDLALAGLALIAAGALAGGLALRRRTVRQRG